ncbi:hypothetical protein BKA65DRAFT_504233 [Rhexocercosporidium sp. MPI-PUGE-AT-0058]|nr:hypothetical protein BKA65DRAFT_504233 [Rhexocercosporidium sp. MPI-PUGE-AT-0058]
MSCEDTATNLGPESTGSTAGMTLRDSDSANADVRLTDTTSTLASFDAMGSANTSLDSSNDSRFNTFTLFPKLPLELRHLIWKSTFPRPYCVDMMTYPALVKVSPTISLGAVKNIMNRAARERFPIALSINQESRTEALQYYFVVHNDITNLKIAPYYINTKADHIFLNVRAALNIERQLTWKNDCWPSQLADQTAAKRFSGAKVGVLTFTGCVLGPNIEAGILRCHADQGQTPAQDDESFCCIFKFFPAMEELDIIISQTDDVDYLQAQDQRRLGLFIRQVLEHHAKEFSFGKVPEINIGVEDAVGRFDWKDWEVEEEVEDAESETEDSGAGVEGVTDTATS